MSRPLILITISSTLLTGVVLVALSNITSTWVLPEPDPVVKVVVAKRDLHQGVPITQQDLYAVNLPSRFVPEGAIIDPDTVIGRVPHERVLHNEFVRTGRLADGDDHRGLQALLPPNMRAISIEIGEAPALAGKLKGGHLVDVLVTREALKSEPQDGKRHTVTFLQSIFVMGVNGIAEDPQNQPRQGKQKRKAKPTPTVTLMVTAPQAEELVRAQALGKLHLSLRRDSDYDYYPFLRQQFDNRPSVVAERKRQPNPIQAGICHPTVLIRGSDREWIGWNETTGQRCQPPPQDE